MLEWLSNVLGNEPPARKFHGHVDVPADWGRHPLPETVQPDSAYFEIRLLEMYLRNARELLAEYRPIAVSLTECRYDKKPLCLPFVVSNALLGAIADHVRDEPVTFSNTRLAGPLPYQGDDIGSFVGLCRVKKHDLLEEAFSVIENVAGAVSLDIGSQLDVVKQVTDGLSKLLGKREAMQMQVGQHTSIDPSELDGVCDRYFILINADEAVVRAADLMVDKDSLMKKSNNKVTAYRDHDYCLARLSFRPRRSDYRSLEFPKFYDRAMTLLTDGKVPQAEWVMMDVYKGIMTSPDLIEDHKHRLILEYRAKFENAFETLTAALSPLDSKKMHAVRGTSAKTRARDVVIEIAAAAGRAGLSASVEDSLLALSDNWKTIGDATAVAEQGQSIDEVLDRELDALEALNIERPDPRGLVEAFAIHALSRR